MNIIAEIQLLVLDSLKKFNIHYDIFHNKYYGWHSIRLGGPTFAKIEETAFVKCFVMYTKWKYPFDLNDIRYIFKVYLYQIRRKVKQCNIR